MNLKQPTNFTLFYFQGMGPRLSHLRVRWDSQRDFYVENQYSFECKTAKDAMYGYCVLIYSHVFKYLMFTPFLIFEILKLLHYIFDFF